MLHDTYMFSFVYFHAQIQTFKVYNLKLHNDQSASYCLGKFLCLLPHLIDLNICTCSLHDDFYKEIADRASSSQVIFLKEVDTKRWKIFVCLLCLCNKEAGGIMFSGCPFVPSSWLRYLKNRWTDYHQTQDMYVSGRANELITCRCHEVKGHGAHECKK